MADAAPIVGPGRRLAASVASLAVGVSLAACAPNPTSLAIGAAATVAVKASQERGLATSVGDDRIWTEINARWLDADAVMFHKLQLQVHEGRALITGVVQKPEMQVAAIRIAWEVDGVDEVIDEIRVAEQDDFGGNLQDVWIVEQLRGRLLIDRAVRAINYSIESVKGTIYLIGIAQSAAELQRVIDHARDIAYVRRVVSYVRIKDAA
jgi:osmotically-inducible protein OsmY